MSGYAAYLRAMLRPLGVYDLREQSCSGAELEAIGAGLDAAAGERAEDLRQTLGPTATEPGLRRWESLLWYTAPGSSLADRRAVLCALLAVSWDSFTPAALTAAARACGVLCTIEETGPCSPLLLRFPGIYGRPQPWARARWILEELMPAHLELIYLFRWITWQETHEKRLTWGQVSRMSWYRWMSRDF